MIPKPGERVELKVDLDDRPAGQVGTVVHVEPDRAPPMATPPTHATPRLLVRWSDDHEAWVEPRQVRVQYDESRAMVTRVKAGPQIGLGLLVGAGVLIAGVVLAQWWTAIVGGLVTAALAVLMRLRVSDGPSGVEVRSWTGIPLRRIPRAQIVRTRVGSGRLDGAPWGLGYRTRAGATSLLIRSGRALVVELRDGRRFFVSLGDDVAA